ncbi:MAG: hypothetical protein ACJ8EJ_04480 [Xanthobacteraceae bacterium]
MIRSFVGAMLLASCTLPALAETVAAADDLRALPMTFELRREGPADVCGTKCRSWISAVGSITSDTPRQFDNFARTHEVRGAVIALDSGGGSVLGTLELGRMLRRLDIMTTVGRTTILPADKNSDVRAILSPKADCESMCAFLLLAGTRRYVPAEAKVLVHQIWLGDRRDDATAATYSAEDIMVIQRDIGRLVQFTAEMGGGADLVETALRIPPWERLRPMSAEELVRAKLQTGDNPFDPPTPEPAVSSSASTAATTHVAAVTDRGWSIIEKSGRPMLARRHPLTIEGEEIGSFDLIFACSGNTSSYTATYTETRQRPGSRRVPVALKDVSLGLGRDSAVLRVVASETAGRPPELLSSARGVVSANLVKGFAEWGNRALMIETATTNNQETAIRVGNTGLAQLFPKFAAACAK